MTNRSRREALAVQLMETERLLQIVGDHPVMSMPLQQKADEIRQELKDIPLDQKEAKVSLFFSGKPVVGSAGINALFASKVLQPFQNMVKTDFAQRVLGNINERGPAKGSHDSQLFITALPRGSFGIELTKLQGQTLFGEVEMADTLVHIASLIEASAKSDEDYAVALSDAPARTIKSLNDFLKVVSEEEAGVTIESGGIRVSLTAEDARVAYNRVSTTQLSEDTVSIQGILRGVMLNSWRFDFTPFTGEPFSGRFSDELSENEVKSFFAFLDQPCSAAFEESKVVFKNGQLRTRYTLLSLKEAQPLTTINTTQVQS
jgi:hypothetical protein